MKIEKLTENKIRIILNLDDLKEKNIDYNSILDKPIESQQLFLEMLLKAEKEVGFYTEGCKLLVEAFSSSEGFFIFTITKFVEKKSDTTTPKKRVVAKKKTKQLNTKSYNTIYKFADFEAFCNFCNAIDNIEKLNIKKLCKNISLYIYNDVYYLTLSDINIDYEYINTFYSAISEFATLVSHSDTFYTKLAEHGKIIIKKNAIDLGIKYFVKK